MIKEIMTPKKQYHYTTLEDGIQTLLDRAKDSPVSIGEILELLSGKGRPLLLIFLSLPFCQPLQIPGLSTPFGLLIAFMGLRMAFGRHLWLPKKLLSKVISSETVTKIGTKLLSLIKKMQKWFRPRLEWICHHKSMEIINGLTIAFLGILLALPLPIPFSNLLFAWPIFLMSLGICKDDGLFVLIGYPTAILALVVFVEILFQLKWLF